MPVNAQITRLCAHREPHRLMPVTRANQADIA